MQSDYFFGSSEEGFHKVNYYLWGSRQKNEVPVICVHGMTRNGSDFDTLADHLASQGKQIYCPDIVGRGNSDWLQDAKNYSFEQYASDMVNMIARTGANEIDWVGTSMGGIIGMIIAAMPNSPIRRLIINDIGPQIPAKAIRRLSRYAGKDPIFHSIDEAIKYYKIGYSTFGDLSEEQWKRITLSSIRQTDNGFISKVDPGIKHVPSKGKFIFNLITHPYKTLQGPVFDINLWYLWDAIKCPTYLIYGEKSDLVTPAILTKMRASKSNMQVMAISNVGHAPVLESDEQIEQINNWLS